MSFDVGEMRIIGESADNDLKERVALCGGAHDGDLFLALVLVLELPVIEERVDCADIDTRGKADAVIRIGGNELVEWDGPLRLNEALARDPSDLLS
jgi:hypothetical protein